MERKIVKGYTTDEDIKVPIIEFIKVTNKYIKFYEAIESKLLVLNRIDLMLLYFLAGSETKDKIIYSNIKTRDSFREYILKVSDNKVKYTDGSVVQAFSHLKKHSILITVKGVQAAYYINPMFVFVGLERERKAFLNEIDIEEFNKENEIRKSNLKL